MGLFSIKNPTLEVIRRELTVPDSNQTVSLRMTNPYLAHFLIHNAQIFTSEKLLKGDSRRIKGELPGAVMLPRLLPSPDSPKKIPVVIPVRRTHDENAYAIAHVWSDILPDNLLLGRNPRSIAHEVASLAVRDYLEERFEAPPAAIAENAEPMMQVILRNVGR